MFNITLYLCDCRVNSEETLEEMGSPSNKQHDNYINFDIAQIVVKESRQEQVGPKSPGTWGMWAGWSWQGVMGVV